MNQTDKELSHVWENIVMSHVVGSVVSSPSSPYLPGDAVGDEAFGR